MLFFLFCLVAGVNSVNPVERNVKCDILFRVGVWKRARETTRVSPPPIWGQLMWVGLLHVSIALLQHLLPLTFRPPPHTLHPQRMLCARSRGKIHSPATGDFPWCLCMFVCVCVCVCVCVFGMCVCVSTAGDSRTCRLRVRKAEDEI